MWLDSNCDLRYYLQSCRNSYKSLALNRWRLPNYDLSHQSAHLPFCRKLYKSRFSCLKRNRLPPESFSTKRCARQPAEHVLPPHHKPHKCWSACRLQYRLLPGSLPSHRTCVQPMQSRTLLLHLIPHRFLSEVQPPCKWDFSLRSNCQKNEVPWEASTARLLGTFHRFL